MHRCRANSAALTAGEVLLAATLPEPVDLISAMSSLEL